VRDFATNLGFHFRITDFRTGYRSNRHELAPTFYAPPSGNCSVAFFPGSRYQRFPVGNKIFFPGFLPIPLSMRPDYTVLCRILNSLQLLWKLTI
ncbi:MAG: hypothetical protein V3T39_09435, partial [Gammaproteobacteria bacterium]